MNQQPLGVIYEQNGEAIDRADMVKQLKAQPPSEKYVRSHQTWSIVTLVTAAAGGALVGYPVGQAIAGEPAPLWGLAGAGAGLIAISIPMAVVADKKLKKGVQAYNDGLTAPALRSTGESASIKVVPTQAGALIGLSSTF